MKSEEKERHDGSHHCLTPHTSTCWGRGSFASLFHVGTVLLSYKALLIIITFVKSSISFIINAMSAPPGTKSNVLTHFSYGDDRAVSSGKYLDLQRLNNCVFPHHNCTSLVKPAEGEGETVFSVDFCDCMTAVITTTNN